MLIKYKHIMYMDAAMDHSTVPYKIHDTVAALRNNPFIAMTQDEFDKFTLDRMAQDKKKGYVLEYEVITKEEMTP